MGEASFQSCQRFDWKEVVVACLNQPSLGNKRMFPQRAAEVPPHSVWCVYSHSKLGHSGNQCCSKHGHLLFTGWYMIISGKLSGSAGWCDNFTLRSQSLHQRRDVWAAGTALLVITFKKVTGGWATAFLVQNRHHTDNCLATFKEKVIIKKL